MNRTFVSKVSQSTTTIYIFHVEVEIKSEKKKKKKKRDSEGETAENSIVEETPGECKYFHLVHTEH